MNKFYSLVCVGKKHTLSLELVLNSELAYCCRWLCDLQDILQWNFNYPLNPWSFMLVFCLKLVQYFVVLFVFACQQLMWQTVICQTLSRLAFSTLKMMSTRQVWHFLF